MAGKMISPPVTPPQPRNQRHQRPTLQGGYETDFVETPSSDLELKCPICLLIMKDPYHPVTCKCGTHFCKTCIEPVYKSTKLCPVCKDPFNSIAPNVALKRTIDGKQVYCTYKEDRCGWKGELRKLEVHLKDASTAAAENCQYYPEPCTFCDVPIQRRSMFDHRSSKCHRRPYHCDHCNKYKSNFTDVVVNHIPKCELAPTTCSNAGCDERMLRKDLIEHINNCPETVVRCEFAHLGCEDSFKKKESHDHYERKMLFHMGLMAKHGSKERQELKHKLDQLESENKRLNDKLKKTSDEVDALRKENDDLSQEYSRATNKSNNIVGDLKEKVEVLRKEVNTLRENLDVKVAVDEQKHAALSKEVHSVKEECLVAMNEESTKNHSEYTSRLNSQVKIQVGQQIKVVKREMKQESTSLVTVLSGRVDGFEEGHRQMKQTYGTLKYQVTQHTEDLKSLATRVDSNLKKVLGSIEVLEGEAMLMRDKVTADRQSLEKLDSGLEDLHDLSYVTLLSGIGQYPVIILLREYAKWQVRGNAEWSSFPFYLDGYKLCLSAFVNGDPTLSAHGYFSLYVHLMKGESDSKLSWPFQRSVCLELLHPDDEVKNKKYTLPFDSSLDKKYTGRVTGHKRAKGWGYAKFISHAELNKFLRGEREFLKIRVS